MSSKTRFTYPTFSCITLIFSLLLPVFTLQAQVSASDSTRAKQLYETGMLMARRGQLKQSAERLIAAAGIFHQMPDYNLEIETKSVAIRLLLNIGSREQAIQLIGEMELLAQQHPIQDKKLSELLRSKADYYQSGKQLIKAQETLDRAIQLIEDDTSQIRQQIGHLIVKGNLEHRLGFTVDAKETYTMATEKIVTHFGDQDEFLQYTYNGLGVLLADAADFFKAQRYYFKALYIAELAGNKRGIAFCTGNLANALFRAGRSEEALKYQHQALALHKEIHGPGHIEVARSHYNIGSVHEVSADYPKAMVAYNKALRLIGGQNNDDANLLKARCLAGQARIARQQKQEAGTVIQLNEEVSRLVAGVTHDQSARYLLAQYELAEAYAYSGQFLKALELNETILSALLPQKSNTISVQNLDLAAFDLMTADITLDALYQRCDLLVSLEATESADHRASIQETAVIGLKLLDYLKSSDLSFSKKQRLIADNSGLFRHLLSTASATQDTAAFFQALEAYRLNSIHSQLINTDQDLFLSIPADILTREQNIKDRISYQLDQLNTAGTDTLRIQSAIFDLERQQDSLREVLVSQYPQYHQIQYQNNVIDQASLKAVLNEQEALISYYLGSTNVRIMVITKNGSLIKNTPIDSSFHQAIDLVSRLVSSNPSLKPDDFTVNAHLLYQHLLSPVRELISGKSLILIPDGQLNTIPFEILLRNKAAEDYDYRTLPYLIKDHDISYAISASFLTRLRNQTRNQKEQEVSGITALAPFSNIPKTTAAGSLQPLSHTLEEVMQLQSFFDTPAILTGGEATEKSFRGIPGNHILHIASHGLIDSEDPLRSKIVLANDPQDSLYDQYLHVYELYNHDLPNQMTVLTACHSASGTVLTGEGVIGLTHGFFYAGAESVLSSLWYADDRSTTQLMGLFYEGIDSGLDKGKALREAKIKHLEQVDSNLGHPYFWASLVLSGDTRPLKLQKDGFPYYSLIFGGLGIALIGFYMKRGR